MKTINGIDEYIASLDTISDEVDITVVNTTFPTVDLVTNDTLAQAVGNKDDTVAGTSLVALNKQEIVTIDTIEGNQVVPTQNSADNLIVRDLIGNKTDTHVGNSIYSILKLLGEHFHSPQKLYPTLANEITVVGAAGAWVLGSFVE